MKQITENITEAALVGKLIDEGSSGLPGREMAVLALRETPIPTRKTEAYKYTPVAKYLKKELPFGEVVVTEMDHRPMDGVCTLVFVNGRFDRAHSDELPTQAGVTFGLLSEQANNPIVQDHYDKLVDHPNRFFDALNTCSPSDGIVLLVDRNTAVEKPIRVVHYTHGEILSQPRDLIVLGDGAKAEVFFEQRASAGNGSLVNHVRESHIGVGARLIIHRLQEEKSGPFHICKDAVLVQENGYFDIDTTTLDGAVIRNDIRVELKGPNAHAQLNGVYMVGGSTHVDNHTYIGHDVPDCTSDELYKGIVDGKATAVFNGKVQVAQDAQRTRAYQSNQNIIISETANVYTKPELEIYADDVRCSHGCTIGRLDDEALFYLRSRGISRKEAMRLLTLAFCDDVLERIENEDWRSTLSALIEKSST